MRDPQEGSELAAPIQAEGDSTEKQRRKDAPTNNSRRSFLGKMGVGSAAAVALAAVPLEPLISGKKGEAEASVVNYNSANRAAASYNYRTRTAAADYINIGELPDNGDAERFSDFSGSWSKCLPHPY